MSGISQESAGDSRFRMVDVGEKTPTRRRAIASGRIFVGEEAYGRIREGSMPKGDLLALAEAAGVMAAKRASDFIPLCHPLGLDQVRVRFEWEPEQSSIKAICEAIATAKTGVEMEALAGAQAALLSIYDLTKGVNPALWISDLHLELKEGGKSGHWEHPGSPNRRPSQESAKKSSSEGERPLRGLRAAVIVASDRASKGDSEDISGPTAVGLLEGFGASVSGVAVVPDERELLARAIRERASGIGALDLLIISGGTGLGPRDVSPEALELASQTGQKLTLRRIPGVGEVLRSGGAKFTPLSWLSRSEGAFLGQTLVILLPGSPKAVTQGLEQLKQMIPHLIQMSRGGGHG